MFENINYWAVVVAGIANMAVGMLWYGPLFGNYWMRLMGLTKESMKSMGMSPQMAMMGGVVASLLLAFGLSVFSALWGAVTVIEALTFALFAWVTFSVTTLSNGFLWEGKSFNLFLLNIAHALVAYGVVAVIVVLWQ